MLKKIIIIFVITISTGMISCSMWDDVDKNAVFEIPVADITVINNGAPNLTQWYGIPVFAKNDKSKNPVSYQSINQIQVATNRDKTKLYFIVELNGPITVSSYYVLVLSNDYNCDGYYINFALNSWGPTINFKNTTCGNSLVIVNVSNYLLTANTGYTRFEGAFDIPAELFNLKNNFLISIYSTNNGIYPSIPAAIIGSSTKTRWAKLK